MSDEAFSLCICTAICSFVAMRNVTNIIICHTGITELAFMLILLG